MLIATVNEDANSSIYTIKPGAKPGDQVRHYDLQRGAATLRRHGRHLDLPRSRAGERLGTRDDGHRRAVSQATPAVYSVVFDPLLHVATITPVFNDGATAHVANVGASIGKVVSLALTDPDSNEVVPASGPRFAGDFMLTSQGDQEQIYLTPYSEDWSQAGPPVECSRSRSR